MESLDVMYSPSKNAASRRKRPLLLAALIVGTTLVMLVLSVGHSTHRTLLQARSASGMETSLAVRPDYPISSFVYERGVFRWLIGTALNVLANPVSGVILAFTGVGYACSSVTGAATAFGCVFAALGAIGAVAGAWNGGLGSGAKLLLYLAANADIQTGAYPKRGLIDAKARSSTSSEDFTEEHRAILDRVFGPSYHFDSFLTKDSTVEHHRELVRMNGGDDVPVFRWTTGDGIALHHAYVYNEVDGSSMHRFGMAGNNTTPQFSKRGTVPNSPTEETFSSGGIDMRDCNGGDSNHIEINQQVRMQYDIDCNSGASSTLASSSLQLMIFDATTNGVIANSVMAPFNNGKSLISSGTNCPGTDGISPNYSCNEDEDQD